MQSARRTALALFALTAGASHTAARQHVPLIPNWVAPQPSAIATTSGALVTIHTTIPGHPSSLIPGLAGARFLSLGGDFSVSPVGKLALAAVGNGGGNDHVLLVEGNVVARAGETVPFAAGHYVTLSRVTINDAGAVAFSAQFSAPPYSYVVGRTAGGNVFSIAAAGDPIPAIPGSSYFSLGRAQLLADGSAFVECYANPGGYGVVRGSELVLSAVPPTHQPGGQLQPWYPPGAPGYFWAGTSGEHWLTLGWPTQVVLDGRVVIQGKQVLAASAYTSRVSQILSGVHVDDGGHWFIHGRNADGQSWVVRDGKLIVEGGGPVPGSPGESFASAPYAVFYVAGDGGSGWAVIGSTDAPDATNQVIATSSSVLVRKRDPIDLDANGQFDDDAYLGEMYHHAYAADQTLFLYAEVRDASGALRGRGLFKRVP